MRSTIATPRRLRSTWPGGVDPNTFDTDGQTAMTICGRRGNAEIAGLLLDAGAEVDACGSSYAMTALCLAAIKNDVEVVTVLLDAGADINIHCTDVTPLACATKSGRVEMMKFLIERGARVIDDNGKSMLAYIEDFTRNREQVEQLLREHGAE